jgi:8-oxo-dGTP pyrophosphatase MutT (NUDIX family)
MSREINGTAMVVVFNDELTEVAIGLDVGGDESGMRRYPKFKFFGGTITAGDGNQVESKDAVAKVAMLRELKAEAGLTVDDLDEVHLVHKREGEGRDRVTGFRRTYTQFFFLAVAKAGTVLPDEVEESDEMINRQFKDVVTVLKAWRLPHDSPNRFNPVHAIALVRCLIVLRDCGAARVKQKFSYVLSELEQGNIRLESYIQDIEEAMSRREV